MPRNFYSSSAATIMKGTSILDLTMRIRGKKQNKTSTSTCQQQGTEPSSRTQKSMHDRVLNKKDCFPSLLLIVPLGNKPSQNYSSGFLFVLLINSARFISLWLLNGSSISKRRTKIFSLLFFQYIAKNL